MSAVFPPPLEKGGTLGVVAPSCWPELKNLARSKAMIKSHGYRVVIHPQCYKRDGQLAGDDATRVAAIHDMFADPAIDAVWCARGGNGAIRLLDRLDYKLIKHYPKPIIGYSDITVLLHAIKNKCGFVTYHGPLCAVACGERGYREMFAVIGGKKNYTARFKAAGVKTGKAEGVLTGGNIAMLHSLIGTPYDWSGKDAILFMEDIDEPVYRLDRMLRHMKLAGKFDGLCAVIIGEMTNIYDGETSLGKGTERRYGRSLADIVREVLPTNIPMCTHFPCGHGKYLTTLPIGAKAKVVIGKRETQISFSRP